MGGLISSKQRIENIKNDNTSVRNFQNEWRNQLLYGTTRIQDPYVRQLNYERNKHVYESFKARLSENEFPIE